MPEQAFTFDCEGSQLVAILHRPEDAARAQKIGVVVVVGGPQYRVGSHRQFTLMARAFCRAGYPVLRFDYRGIGDSEGVFRGFEQVDADIRAAIDALLSAAPDLKGVILWGLCDAASACLMFANRNDPRVAGLIIANPWVRSEAGEARAYLKHYYLQRLLQKSFWQKVLGGAFNPVRAVRELAGLYSKAQTGEDAGGIGARSSHFIDRMYAGLDASRFPVLLLISEVDLTAKEFLDHCERRPHWQALLRKRQVREERLPGVDHTFSTENGLPLVIDRCLTWLGGPGQRA